MKIAIKEATQGYRTTAMVAVMALAGLLLTLSGAAREAQAAFPGKNGKIAFAFNRATGLPVIMLTTTGARSGMKRTVAAARASHTPIG